MPRSAWFSVVCVSGLLIACLHDYDQFQFDEPARAGSAGASPNGGVGGEAATGGSPVAGTPSALGGEGGETIAPAGGSPSAGAPSEPGAGGGPCEDGQTACGEECSDLTQDPLNCGACATACSSVNVALARCVASACSPQCAAGFADCSDESQGGGDGCERDIRTDDASCGSCSNDCRQQGNDEGFSCEGARCGCSSSSDCAADGLGTASCDQGSRTCVCGGVECVSGEACVQSGLNQVCSCNGGSACPAGDTCCQTPDGCYDLASDAQNCGACGNACAGGSSCFAGQCQ